MPRRGLRTARIFLPVRRRQENATMAPFDTFDAAVFADTDPGNALTAVGQTWTMPADATVPPGNDGGLGALDARAAAIRTPVDPGRHPFGGGPPASGSSPMRQ